MSPELLVLLILLAARAGWLTLGSGGFVRRFVTQEWPEKTMAPPKPPSPFWSKLYAFVTVAAFGFGSLYVLLRFIKWAWTD